MPVRVYDIAKKLGVESKDVIAKAKELGIAAARAPSSALDKITAEYLESHLTVPGSSATLAVLKPADEPNVIQRHPPVPGNLSSAPKADIVSFQISTTDRDVLHLFRRIQEGTLSLQIRFSVSSHDSTVPTEEFSFRLSSSENAYDSGSMFLAGQGLHSAKRDLDPRSKKLLLAAYRAASVATDSEWITLAEYGNTLKKLDSSFSARLLGGRSLLSFASSYPEFFEIAQDEMHMPPVPYVRVRKEGIEELSSDPKVDVSRSPGSAAEIQASPLNKSAPNSKRIVGTTGRIHNIKEGFGFGFIKPDVGGENIYFHASDLIGISSTDLRAGDRVSYIPSMNDRGPCAREVKKLVHSDPEPE